MDNSNQLISDKHKYEQHNFHNSITYH